MKDNSDLTPSDRLSLIVDTGLCIGCGLCQSVAGPNQILIERAANGYEYPVAREALDHESVDRIYDTCPGVRIDGLPKEQGQGDPIDPVWGTYRRVTRAYAADPAIRHIGSTGGVLTALGIYLLESSRVDFILHVKASRDYPIGGQQQISRSRKEVLDAAGSRYGPAAPLIDLPELLNRGQRFAFIGKPCDVSALRSYARHDPRVDALCQYFLTLVCGGYGQPQDTFEFIRSMGLDPDEVIDFRYRGYGCPGATRAETHDGQVVEKNYLDFWGEDENSWSLPFRCKICPDAIGESADLAVSDTWLGGSPAWKGQEDDPGTNAIVVRTNTGDELLESALQHGVLAIERNIDIREMDVYQPHQVDKKYAAWGRHAGLRAARGIAPVTHRLRIRELAKNNTFRKNLTEARGTRQRMAR